MKSPGEDPQPQQSTNTIFIKDGKILEGLPPEAYTKQRDGDIAQAVKGLFIINGGGALALLAFFKEVWTKEPSLARAMLWSIGFLVIGAGFAGAVHLVRYEASKRHQQGDGDAQTFSKTYLYLASCSLGCFIVAMIWTLVWIWFVLQPTSPS
jgi:hypothetical protein